MTLDTGHGRIEWRGIEVAQTTPTKMGFPHAAQVARIDRIRELKSGKQEVETVWVLTSLRAEEATPEQLLELVRLYWSIENGTHYPLDISAGEDLCRVPHPVCVFRGETDSCSNRSRTVFRIISDSVPIDIGRDSGLRPDSFATGPERCPINPGIVSDLVRNAVGFAAEWCLI